MKRVVALALAVALAIGLGACDLADDKCGPDRPKEDRASTCPVNRSHWTVTRPTVRRQPARHKR